MRAAPVRREHVRRNNESGRQHRSADAAMAQSFDPEGSANDLPQVFARKWCTTLSNRERAGSRIEALRGRTADPCTRHLTFGKGDSMGPKTAAGGTDSLRIGALPGRMVCHK